MASLLIERLAQHATERPEATAVAGMTLRGRRRLNWAELCGAAGSLAGELERTLPPRGAVLLGLPNGPAYVVAFLAGLLSDRPVFPVSPLLTASELHRVVTWGGVVGAIGTGDGLGAIAPRLAHHLDADRVPLDGAAATAAKWIERHRGCGSLRLQSSGTTGLPKIVERSAEALDAVGRNCANALGLGPEDRMLACVPLYHSYGIDHGLMAAVVSGCAVEAHGGLDPAEVERALFEGAITTLPGVPFLFEALGRIQTAAGPSHRLRHAYSAGAPLPAEVADRFEAATGVRIGQVYGSTELGSVTFNDPYREPYDPTLAGRSLQGVELRILDAEAPDATRPLPPGAEGQVAVTAPSMLSRYLDEAELPKAGPFLLTGDLGLLDAMGRLRLTGRTSLLIDVGGLKVNPMEVEAILTAHPDVAEAVVVGLPVTPTLNRVRAVVAAKPGVELDVQALRRFARQRLSPHKVPRVIEQRSALPRSPTGKILRQQVVQCA